MTVFSYPDLYLTKDVALYNYLFKQDRLLRSMGETINNLETLLEQQTKLLTLLENKVGGI